MCLKQEITIDQRPEPFFPQGIECNHIALRLAHALFIDGEKRAMQPEPYKARAGRCFALCYFIRMMNRDMINAAGVNIDGSEFLRMKTSIIKCCRCQMLHAHGRTFNVPAGETLTPRGIPFHIAFLTNR